ncbi:MAG: hypothetical protein ACRDYC_07865 [Acidimicrobiales bacterium]
MKRSVLSVALTAAAAIGVSGCSVATLGGLLPLLQGQVNSQAAAQLVATSLLKRVTLPPGSSVVSSSPVASLDKPPSTIGSSNLAIGTLFATVPGGSASFLQFERTNPPNGYTEAFSG